MKDNRSQLSSPLLPPFRAYFTRHGGRYVAEFDELKNAVSFLESGSDSDQIWECAVTDTKMNIIFHNERITAFEAERIIKEKSWSKKRDI